MTPLEIIIQITNAHLQAHGYRITPQPYTNPLDRYQTTAYSIITPHNNTANIHYHADRADLWTDTKFWTAPNTTHYYADPNYPNTITHELHTHEHNTNTQETPPLALPPHKTRHKPQNSHPPH